MREVEVIKPPTGKQRFIAGFASVAVRLLCASLRLRVVGEEKAMAALAEGGILVTWHGRTIIPTNRLRGRGYGTLISISRDGALMAEYQRRLGMAVIRGSTGRRGVAAAREVLAFLASGGIMLLTPDGPRGPTHAVQPGVLFLAQRSGKPIVPGGVAAHPRWLARSWDSYMIPKPFSRAHFVYGEPFFVAPDEPLEAAGQRLTEILNALEAQAESAVAPRSIEREAQKI